MKRLLPLAVLISLLVPSATFAAETTATLGAARSLLTASSSPGNAYLAGISVMSAASVFGDLSALGGSVVVASPVEGDVLLLAGSASVRSPIFGDLRVAGGDININGRVGGDLVVFGYDVRNVGRPEGDVLIFAANATISSGASGKVVIYGNNIALAGEFDDDVSVVAAGRLSISASTTIRGALSYEAPIPAVIPESVVIDGGVKYTSASYLPDAGTSRLLAIASIGFFLFVRIFGALILAGLLAGLFPRVAETIVERVYSERFREILLAMLLGFAVLVAVPVLIVLLAFTFVGMGLAMLLGAMYILLVMLTVLYSGILVGGMFARRFFKRETIKWHDGMLGMLVLSLISLVPVAGALVTAILSLFSAGTLLLLFFHMAFPREESEFETA